VHFSCSKHTFNGPYTGISKGRILCVMWGVNDRNSTLFSTAKSKTLMYIWNLWLSITSRTFLVTVGRNCSTMNCSHWRNVSPLIQPLSVQDAWHPVAAPSRSHSCMHFQTNMRNDRMNEPAVSQQHITVVSSPCSGLAIMPNCFFSVMETNFRWALRWSLYASFIHAVKTWSVYSVLL